MSVYPSLRTLENISDQPAKLIAGSSGSVVVQQSASVLVAQVVLLLCAVINNFLVAYLVGPDGRGLVYLLQFIGGLGLTVLNFGLGPASVFYLGREKGHLLFEVAAGVLWASLLLGILPMAIMGSLWHWIAPLATQKIPAHYLWLALAAIPAINLTFNAGFLCLARKRIRAYNWLRIGPSILFSLGLVAMLFSRSCTIWAVVLLWMATTVTPAFFALGMVQSAGGMRWFRDAKKFLFSAFRFGWHAHIGTVTQYVQHRSDILLVSYFLPLKDLGLYAFAVSLAELLWYMPQAVATVLMPHVAANPDEDAARITPMFCRAVLTTAAILSLALATITSLLVPRLLPAFAGSVRILWLLLPGAILASVFKVLSSDFTGRGKPLETFYPAAIALAACFVLGICFIPRFGVTGAALVTNIGYIVNTGLYVRA